MTKKPIDPYDPNNKESWHVVFEQEPVNDDFWSCIVTAAVPVEVKRKNQNNNNFFLNF